jgi:hypothetical protein
VPVLLVVTSHSAAHLIRVVINTLVRVTDDRPIAANLGMRDIRGKEDGCDRERWMHDGTEDAAARVSKVWLENLAAHEPPALDGAVREEFSGFVAKRTAELGD